jgi:ribosome-binding factor A
MSQARARKLSDRVAQIVAEMLERRIKDPRLGFVTVTAAKVTGDLREATVFYTVLGSDEEVAGTAVALASATGLIRSEVGRQTGIKHTPSITFVRDTIPDAARTIEDLVARAREADAAVAAVRVDAVPAGDADPYRQPAAGDEDDEDDLEDDEVDGDDLDEDDEVDEEDDLDDDDLDDDDEDDLDDEDDDDPDDAEDDFDADDADAEFDDGNAASGPLGDYPTGHGSTARYSRS